MDGAGLNRGEGLRGMAPSRTQGLFPDAIQAFVPRVLDEVERLEWLRLWRTQNVGPVTFRKLLQRFEGPGPALEQLAALGGGFGVCASDIPSPRAMKEEYAAYEDHGAVLIGWCEPAYPPLLRLCPDAPPFVVVKGELGCLSKPLFAIVGARNASMAGKKITATFAQALGEVGWVVVSGLARGIDITAHQASLETGTVAVLPGGIDHIYPPEHGQIAKALARTGALVTEMAPGTPASARLFARRNRLIAGLVRGVLVVEAAPRSGTLLTAQYAAEQGRDVFVVPGHPLDPRSRGGNGLIREGATLVQTPEEVIEFYGSCFQPMSSLPMSSPSRASLTPPLALSQTRSSPRVSPHQALAKASDLRTVDAKNYPPQLVDNILAALSLVPVQVDELAIQLGMPSSLVRGALVEIEIAGYLDRQPGDCVCLLPRARDV